VLDGRHRLAVATERREPTVPVVVQNTADEASAILIAAKANSDGAQPLTMKDLAHTAELLLAAGLTQKDAIERLSAFLPERFVTTIITELRHTRRHRAIFAALRELRAHPELSLKAVAEKHGVTPADLQNRLDRSAEQKVVPVRMAEFTKMSQVLSLKLSKFFQKLFEDYTEGLTEAKVIDAALDSYEQHVRSATGSYRQWVKRWAALRQAQQKAKKASV